MKFHLGLSLLCIALIPLYGATAAQKGDPQKGKTLYSSKCSLCHADSGEGKPAIAKMFKVTLRALGSKEVQARSDAEMEKIIHKGNGKMKPVALKSTEAADVIAYLRTLAEK